MATCNKCGTRFKTPEGEEQDHDCPRCGGSAERFVPATVQISFTVNAVPVAQPRQRHTLICGHVHNYTSANHPVNAFKAAVRAFFSEAYTGPPLDGPIGLDVVFVLPRPKSKMWKSRPMPRERHTSKPDADNLLKAFKDALKGLAWRDDSQVCDVHAEKWIAAGDEIPHVEATIKEA